MMRFPRGGMVAFAAALVVALTGAVACESNIDEDDGASPAGSGGTGTGTGGGSGSSGLQCQPTDPICYGNRPPTSPGSECLAMVDNSAADRVQLRQTWNRVVAPVGNTTQTVYSILKKRAQIELPQCYMTGEGGYIQLTDWDRTNKTDVTQQTLRSGYASYSKQPLTGRTTGDALVSEGLCMVTWDYTFNPPSAVTVAAFDDTSLARWQDAATPVANQPTAQPWHIEPFTAHRVAADFDVSTLRGTVPAGEGRFYVDDTKPTPTIHTYFPLAYVSVLDNRSGGLAVPIREVEVRTQFNDDSFNCVGRFRADVMTQAQSCDNPADQTSPPWGCKDDAACPPAGITEGAITAATMTGPGVSPAYTRGYFLIVDLERVWSSTLQATLCVTYPGEKSSEDNGWSSPTGWGKNCRGSQKWNPSAADDAGLPMGDWCSRTNSAATATCHDAYLSESFSTGQAFKVQDGMCPLQ